MGIASACRQPEPDGRRRTEIDARMHVDSIVAARSCAELTCREPAVCHMQADAPHCVCPAGYGGDPSDCRDIDECALPASNDCGEHAACINRPGNYSCVCEPGYQGDGRLCNQMSVSCAQDKTVCSSDADCVVDAAGAHCVCRAGFEGDGRTCKDLDECQSGTARCAQHARCENQRGSFACSCELPFEGDGRVNCRDTCESAALSAMRCDPSGHGRCAFSPDGQPSCTSCSAGFVGDGVHCIADAECAQLRCSDNSVCAGDVGARRCECAKGFRADSTLGCVDIDECELAGLCASGRCVNTPGSYICACADGFERVNGACVNIDECSRGLDLCDPAADCADQAPGYRCACKPGFEGDGRSCSDVDECARDKNACSGATSCHNLPGSFECVCPTGFSGDGKTQACACDLSGYWGMRIDSVLKVGQLAAGGVTLIEGSETRTHIWELSRFRYDGSEIKIDNKNCGMSDDPEVYSPLYGEVYSSSTPLAVFDQLPLTAAQSIPLARSAALPGMPYLAPREAILQGINLNNPLNAPWPMSTTEVPANAWVDYDHDGVPGVSLWPASTVKATRRGGGETFSYLPVGLKLGSSLVGSRVGCVSAGVRAIRVLTGKIDTCAHISGDAMTERFEGRIYACTVANMADWDTKAISCSAQDWAAAQRCSPEEVQFIDTQPLPAQTGGPFELMKLGGLEATDIDCAKVRAALPAPSGK